MSYDVRLEIDTGGEHRAWVTECRSPTYNLGGMFREALGVSMQKHGDEPALDGMLAADALVIVSAALTRMAAEPGVFRALNPPNGWGNYDSAVEFLRWLQDECRNHPKATVRT